MSSPRHAQTPTHRHLDTNLGGTNTDGLVVNPAATGPYLGVLAGDKVPTSHQDPGNLERRGEWVFGPIDT